mmetsp:Transcript_10066/g.28891  ORF Transcript_10066/g.28891 Transcript_10066/m.28891 type:complete len:213 (+) Transcript_10066:1401-2039(+)
MGILKWGSPSAESSGPLEQLKRILNSTNAVQADWYLGDGWPTERCCRTRPRGAEDSEHMRRRASQRFRNSDETLCFAKRPHGLVIIDRLNVVPRGVDSIVSMPYSPGISGQLVRRGLGWDGIMSQLLLEREGAERTVDVSGHRRGKEGGGIYACMGIVKTGIPSVMRPVDLRLPRVAACHARRAVAHASTTSTGPSRPDGFQRSSRRHARTD